MTETKATTAEHEPHGKVPILIDGTRYVAPEREMTGAQLRALATPTIGPDRDLWLDVDGGLDRVIADSESVELQPQTRFFTVPKVINPGSN